MLNPDFALTDTHLTRIGLGVAAIGTGVVAAIAPNALAVLAVVAGLCAIADIWRSGALLMVCRHPSTQLVAATLVWMAISSLWALHPENSWRTLASLGPLLLFGLALVFAARFGHFSGLEIPLLIGFALTAVTILIEFCTGGILLRAVQTLRDIAPDWDNARVNRATVLLLLLLWPTMLVLRQRGYAWAGLLALGLTALTIWLGPHDTSRIAIIAGVAAWLVVFWLGRPAVLGISFVLVALILLAPLLAAGMVTPEDHRDIADPLFSGVHRLYIWQFTAERIAEQPWFGWGLDASRSIPGGDALVLEGVQILPLHPHNAALQVWLELGVPGVMFFCVLTLIVARGIAREESDRFAQAVAAAALCSVYTVLFLSFGLWQSWWIGALGLALAWILAAARTSRAAHPVLEDQTPMQDGAKGASN